MNFIGEHLLPGQLGHFFILLAFVASLVASFAFFSATRNHLTPASRAWNRLAKTSFYIQVVSVFAVFGILYYICANHMFEYMYAYKHASIELEPKYLLACIWEGQEGSFLLWAICHSLLGLLIVNRKDHWQAPVMGVVTLVQAFLFLMVVGIYIGDVRIGNSPFTLTRNEISAPIFSQPNYLSFIQDGMGLNVLLRNYWMVIHPPVLFLGFAAALIPYAFALSALIKKDYTGWIKPALPFLLLSLCVLGAGIMMGGKWAYESLSFGGYWAWDPVENASLVPWLILVGALHTLLIFMATKRALRATFLFSLLGFSFVLYSTFLTRTGILGDTSVHSFTEAGTAINQMIKTFLFFFSGLGLVLFFKNYKKIPAIHTEEAGNSREFWMFIGSLVIFLSAMFIIAITSIPVYNQLPFIKDLIVKVHGGALAMPDDPEFLYNKVMVLVAIILGLLTAIGQYFKYRKTEKGYTLKKIAVPTLTAAVITTVVAFVMPFTYYKQGMGFLIAIYMAFFAMVYAVVANASYIFSVQKSKWKLAGGSIAHAGFALMIAGMLISSSNKKVISSSLVNGITFDMGSTDPLTKAVEDPQENLTLIRHVPTRMAEYEVTYLTDSSGHESGRRFYHLDFVKKDPVSKDTLEKFRLSPDVYIMKDNNLSSNPDTRTYFTKDVFTYISYALKDEQPEDTTAFREVVMSPGDTAYYGNGYMILNTVLKNPVQGRYNYTDDDVALMADLTVVSKDTIRYNAWPAIEVDDDHLHHVDDTVYAQNLYVRFNGISEDQRIRIGIKESDRLIDFVTVKTYVFPWVNLVWLGIVVMCIGILISMLHRANLPRVTAMIILSLTSIGLFYMFLIANN